MLQDLIQDLSYGARLFRKNPGFTFLGICLLLAVAAALASYIPARRATQVDPLVALRNE